MDTKKLILEFINMIKSGKITSSDVPVEEIQACILLEIDTRKEYFGEKRHQELKEEVNQLFANATPLLNKLEQLHMGFLFLPETDDTARYAQQLSEQNTYNQLSASYSELVEKIRQSLQNVSYFSYIHQDNNDAEVTEILEFMKKNGKPEIFNYNFVAEYGESCDYEIKTDEESGFPYIEYRNLRIYYPKEWENNEKKIKDWHRSILYEQDKQSPHCYECEDKSWFVQEGDVVLDAGAGEGSFTLSVIEKASKIYIVEADPIWQKPLELTFRKWQNKVVFVNKFLSGRDSELEITLDSLIGNTPINFIKMDIEGFEIPALSGAKEILKRKNIRCALCTYHRSGDSETIKSILGKNGFETRYSRGFMYVHDDIYAVLDAELRRGIIYGKSIS